MIQNRQDINIDKVMTAVSELAPQLQVSVDELEKSKISGSEHNKNLLALGRSFHGTGRFIRVNVVTKKPMVQAHGRCQDMERAIDDIQVQFYRLGLYINGTVAAEDTANVSSYTEKILGELNIAKGEFTKDKCFNAKPSST
ncbi:hypothetical protein RJ55_07531 [Drechmeria coniospora]|nr:hypothetical protein RJ55_07531 [Drechmeria coniospora]